MCGCSTQRVNLNPSMKASGFTHVPGPNWSGQLTSKKPGFICNLFAPLPHSHAGAFFICSNVVMKVILHQFTLI